MKGRIFLLVLLVVQLLFYKVSPVLAMTPPDFPACSSQVGAPIIASYTGGTHGIVGDPKIYSGNDTVYALDAYSKVLQCFCADNGSGIQTNWWKASSLTDPDIKVLLSMGWNFIPNGSAWGLSDVPYIAKNTTYRCGGGGIGGGYDDPSTTSFTGLASTGNTNLVQQLLLLGLGSLLMGAYVLTSSKNHTA